MPKCGYCGKFLSNADCLRCSKCASVFHRSCSSVSGPTPPGWSCQGCKAKTKANIMTSSTINNKITPDESSEDSSPRSVHNEDVPIADNLVMRELMEEIRCLRSEMSRTRTEIMECRREILDFKADLQSCCARLNTLEDKVSTLEKNSTNEKNSGLDVEQVNSSIIELQRQLNEREQQSLLNDVEISGLPEEKNENVLHVVGLVATKLGIKLEDRDIVFAERVGFPRRNRATESGEPSSRPRNIVVRLTHRPARDDMLRAARVRRGLTSADIASGEPRRFFVNERLTRQNRQLFAMAREAASRAKWKYVWTKNGNVFARKDDGKVVVRIQTEKDIKKNFIS